VSNRSRAAATVAAAGLLLLTPLAAACGTAHQTSRQAASGGHGVGQDPAGDRPATTRRTTTRRAASTTTSSSTSSTTTIPPTTTTTLPSPQPGWTVVTEYHDRIVTDTRSITLPDGHTVTLIRFHAGTYRLDLHLGSEDPPSSHLSVTAADGDAISAAERPEVVGAFNGGFYTSTGSGGFVVDGQVAVPLVAGYATLAIGPDGSATVGAWGSGDLHAGPGVVSARQNLTLLIDNGQIAPTAGVPGDWGAELYGVPDTARSAVGTDPAGDLVYAGSMAAYPSDMATALADAGVTNAMELDINPYWIQGDVASTPGGPLQAAIPGQQRPAGTYLDGWTRDFFVVLVRP
jgi:hypothetical protein